MGYSKYTERAIAYVSRNPGCCKYYLAKALRWGNICPSKLYYLVNTQIRLGNIVAARERSNTYSLYTLEQLEEMDRQERNKSRAEAVGLDPSVPDGVLRDAMLDAGLEVG